MAIHIVTFADSSMSHMHRRFKAQASAMGVFQNIWCLTEKDLEVDFRNRFRSVLTRKTRGYGFFVWKPQVILQTLSRVSGNDVLLYLDSGSHLVTTGLARFNDYLAEVEEAPSGILAFQLTLPESSWTKGDLLDFLSVRHDSRIVDTPQIQAGAIFLRNSESSREFVLDWLRVFEDRLDLVDDTPSLSPNLPGFVAHRHDQSVFSLLAKIRGVSFLPAKEQFPEHDPRDWETLAKFPIHHRRDKSTKTAKALENARKRLVPIEVLLVKTKKKILELMGSFGNRSN